DTEARTAENGTDDQNVEESQQSQELLLETEENTALEEEAHKIVVYALVRRIKSLVDIDGIDIHTWTPDHEERVRDFILGRGPRKLLAYVDPISKSFFVGEPIPPAPVKHMMYFLTNSSDVLMTEENFERTCQYGSMSGKALDNLLRLMEGFYVPVILQNKQLPESLKKDFSNQMHKFMAQLTEATNQMKGNTVLYVPNEDCSNPELIARSKDTVQRYETLLVHWTRQIKDVLNSQHMSETAENSGPLEEIHFWRSRCDDLSGICNQLLRPDVQRLIRVLECANSSYLDQFVKLSTLIQDGTTQAQDNLKFLSTLTEPCTALSNAEPKQIAAILPKLLNCIRIIWANSRFYNAKERLTSLLRKVSNEIIRRCCAKISLDEVFHGDVTNSMAILQDSISCGESWKSIYRKQCAHIAKFTKGSWDFDQSSIFAQIDAFVQRCRDLLEVCEGQIQFARKVNGNEKSPLPIFGGCRGPEIAKSLEDIELAFEKHLSHLWGIRAYILDVKATRWHDDYNNFKQSVKDLEVMMQTVIISAFECSVTVESSVELLEIFHHLAKRDAIKRTVEKKTADIYLLFMQELNMVKVEFETHRKNPEILRHHPDYAGSANWARSLLKRVTHSYNVLQNASYLSNSSMVTETRTQFEPLAAALEEYGSRIHSSWVTSIHPSLTDKLDTPLMSRKSNGLLEVRFNKDLLRLFTEIHYWQKLKMDIPFHVQEIYSKREELRILRENVLLVVRDYNSIMETLSPDEHALFKERIRFLDRKINPGLTNLTWATKGITDFFVKECRRHIHDVLRTVSEFLAANMKIKKICSQIADTLLWSIENKRMYAVDEFEQAQTAYRARIQEKLLLAHQSIENILQTSFEVFKNDGKEVFNNWIKYVGKTDQMVEDAFRITVKRSLQELSKAINGDNKNHDVAVEIHPLFKINVVLEGQKVDYSPTLPHLEDTVNKVARNMISIIQVIKRLSELQGTVQDNKMPKIYDIIAGEDDIIKIFSSIQNGMSNNAVKCQAYLKNWDSYREIWEINKDAFIRRYAKLKPALSTFDADINRYNEVANNTQKEETLTNINFVRLDCSPLKHALVTHCTIWQNKLTTLLNSNASSELSNLHDMFTKKSKLLKTTPTDLDHLSETLALLAQLQSDLPSIEASFGPIHEQYQILEKYEVPIKEDEKMQLETLQASWVEFQQTIVDAEKFLTEQKARFRSDLIASVEEFSKNVAQMREEFQSKGPYSASFGVERALKAISEYKAMIQNATNREKMLKKGLSVFKIDQSPSKDIELMSTELESLYQIWQCSNEWGTTWNEYKSNQFLLIDASQMEESVQKFIKRLQKMGKDMKEWDVYNNLKERVTQIRRTIPVLLDLKNPAMRERHWKQLMDEIGKTFDPQSTDFTLEKVMELGLDQFGEAIAGFSSAAKQELIIEESLNAIKEAWAQLDLDIVPYKDDKGYFKIRNPDPVFELLEENLVSISSMKTSKYFVAFELEIDHWERSLSHIIEVIEVLLQVQRQWIYLENIFVGTEDIRKQLPKESHIFDEVNAKWKDTMLFVVSEKNVLKATHKENILSLLNDMNQKLEKVQKSLDMYLETKRMAFPRFYFISNDDLLEILGQSRDPNAVQPHLKKCFDNLYKLELQSAGTDIRRHTEAIGMYSGDGEYVPMYAPIMIEGQVEYWLTEIETAMRITLRRLLMGCLISMKKLKKDKWIKDWAGMLLITASLISWTLECTKALQEIEKGDKHALKTIKKKQISNLKKLSDIVKTPLNKVERKKLIALVTIEVHSRDVMDRMLKANCSSINAFEWLSQLRFYWEKEGKDDEDCFIRQINTQFRYGYEYLGNSGRLVITPLTDRCYMTLTMALRLFRGGSPQGPAGTGKTETVKDLGKALGKYVIVINCSEALDYKSMGRMFSGLSQTGAWGCFDEFNRIDIEVLSVVALQVSSILSAITRNAKVFVFEGQEIKLNPTCGIFITMNPGYAGRTELPDNLKSLFRPVSMMVPDSALIAEIMLFAEGFSNTRSLSKKVDTLYKLAIQQLSKQDHYDFGLRALTSALRSAGARKRMDMSVPDEIVLFMSMRDNNIPKLTAEDVPLFSGMLSDLFPGVEAVIIDYTEFKTALADEMRLMKLQIVDNITTKVIQLHETKQARHGVMIVGQSGSGKSTTWKLLQATMSKLSKSVPDKYVSVKIYPINPKSLSQGELYGEFNLTSNEWTDGILSSVMRIACSDEKRDQKWIVLDGPVDTLWIESMNTVLDDNKVLTLINGERIAMPEQVSLLFEVEDLSTASPATVSRAGMIYLDYKDLGWRPYVESWAGLHPDKQFSETIWRLIEKYFPKILDFRQTSASEPIVVTEMCAVRSFCTLFDSLATAENGVEIEDTTSYARMIELWFLFSVIWSFGGSLTEESRKKFDMFLREIEGQFPSKDTVYEYYVDKQAKGWSPWEDKVPSAWRYSPTAPFYKIFVPTIDTIRNEFVIKTLINKRNPVLIIGDVGTGKTSLMHNILFNPEDARNTLLINMSAQTSSNSVQSILESKVEKRTKNVFVPIGGKYLHVFIDDLNMPVKDTFGSQPPLELIRHWIDYGFLYDRQKQFVKHINDILILAAMGPPGGGRTQISARIQGRFNILNMTLPNESSVNRIFGSIINQKLQDFEEDIKPLGDLMTHATVEIYNTISTKLLPTPSKIHYLFNLRDLSKVFQGLLRAHREYYDSKDSVVKLWVHEVYRVFHDRLINKEDREFFGKLVDEKLIANFSLTLKQLCPDKHIPLFGDFMSEAETPIYEEISDNDKLKKFMLAKLQEYNSEPGFIPLDIVLFGDAINHICRIARILRLPLGNVLLIGVGGSGRRSLTQLASYVVECSVFQIKITKQYRHIEFREDLKTLYRLTGLSGKPTVFLFTDTQILSNSFLEDVSNILSSSEVPNLWAPDELNEIRTAMAEAYPGERDPEYLYRLFIDRVRNNLHIVLCMSPVGDAFRNRLRMFPSLINCSTIDWFAEWPEDALLEVAMKYLDNINLADTVKKAVSNTFVYVHMSVVEASAKMISELKRYNYVTPINYMELVIGYQELLNEKRKEIGDAAQKLKNGLSKLDDTRKNVEKISVELEVAKKQVAQYQKQCEDYLVIIVQQKREADEQAKSVAAKAEKLGGEEEEVRAVAEAAQADLDQAMPALNAAVKALESINKKDLGEIKSYGKPPPLVEKVLEAVMILKKCEPTWDEAKRQLGNPYFIKQLVGFDKDNISDKILKRISQYCADENFHPDIVGRVSGAAKSLCMWVKAMETYGIIFRQVAPKKEKLRSAQETLEKKQSSLREAKSKLQEIQDKLIELKNQYDEKVALKEKLRRDSEETEVKLERAEKLVSGLSGERERWENSIKHYEGSMSLLPGDCLIAAAFLSYAGPFNSAYRQNLVNKSWFTQIKTSEIPYSPEFKFETFLGKTTTIRDWNLQGLPSDAFSSENGIIVTRGRRWPIMIDPQGQANVWVKNMEGKRQLKLIDFKQQDFLRTLENAIQSGTPVLLQGILEFIDPSIDPILTKSFIKRGGKISIKLGDKEIDYNNEFCLYLTTKLANPHYAPEVFAKACVVNFAVKEKGLEDQLLGIVVKREKPELEEQKNTLVVNVAEAKKKLVQLEDEILYLLSTAQGSLLDDEKLVNTLQSSKSIAEEVTKQLAISEQTEKHIDAAREAYRPSAQRASILYFVLNDLATIDSMYQFSLDAYIELFDKSIAKSKRHDNIADRIASLNDYHTYSVYKNTCRGLFGEHKLLFSLQMTVKIMDAGGKLNKDEYDFFLHGGQVLDKDAQLPNPCSEWIVESSWDNITELDNLPAFSGLISSIEQSEREWRGWFLSSDPEVQPLPGEWDNKLNDLQKMLIIRSLRSDRVLFCAQTFVVNNLGQKFTEPPILDMADILLDSAPKIPLIFILSPGVDPTLNLQQLAGKEGMSDKFSYLSLGQGQAPKATRLIQNGIRDGNWVFLANCHLSISWMPSLDKIVENLAGENPHQNFRLWLSSSPHPSFPISILQSGIKITTEPPIGLKSNMSRLYAGFTDEDINKTQKTNEFKKLLFNLAFFHSLLLERKKFLTLGWNVVADFNDSDFDVSKNLLEVLLDEYNEIPWDALKYIIAEANYGGRVTDDWDRRILRSYINATFLDEAMNTSLFKLCTVPNYFIPETFELHGFRDYITTLPGFEKPEVFGQHPNADIASQIKASNNMLDSLLLLQPQTSVGGSSSREEKVSAILADIAKRIPELLDYETTFKALKHDMSPLNVVLLQEMSRYNMLLSSIQKSVAELEKGIKGLVLMSSELEEIFLYIYEGRVPLLWKRAYPSLKPLAAWLRDLIQRIEFFSDWSKGVEQQAYWLGAFTFPTGFLTAVLQKTARKNSVPIDLLSWEFSVLQLEDDNHLPPTPKEGVYIRGLYLEGASWDRKNNCLKEPKAMELITSLPPVHFKPVDGKKKTTKGVYVCPLYYYPIRTGTRERPSFILALELKSGGCDQDFWIKRGTASLASLQ
ncbi:dynein heavy chain and region D6 of dynein motor-domain-containing protein, partial [Cladochytrium replicatum]